MLPFEFSLFSDNVRVPASDYTVNGLTFTINPSSNYIPKNSFMIDASIYNFLTLGEIPSGAINGNNTIFLLSQAPLSAIIFSDNIRVPATEYTITGSVIVFNPGSLYIPKTRIVVDYYTAMPATVIVGEIESGVNGSNTTFTLANIPVQGTLQVYSDNVRVSPTEFGVSGDQLIFNNGSQFIPRSSLVIDYKTVALPSTTVSIFPQGLVNGFNTVFSLTPIPQAAVYSDNVRVPAEQYTVVSDTITFTPGSAFLPRTEIICDLSNFEFSIVSETPTGNINGSNTVFTLLKNPYGNLLAVYSDDIRVPSSDYTISGNIITFNVTSKYIPTSDLIVDYYIEPYLGAVVGETPPGVNGSNTTFTLQNIPASATLAVYSDNIRVMPSNFTLVRNILTFDPGNQYIPQSSLIVDYRQFSTPMIVTSEIPHGATNGSNNVYILNIIPTPPGRGPTQVLNPYATAINNSTANALKWSQVNTDVNDLPLVAMAYNVYKTSNQNGLGLELIYTVGTADISGNTDTFNVDPNLVSASNNYYIITAIGNFIEGPQSVLFSDIEIPSTTGVVA